MTLANQPSGRPGGADEVTQVGDRLHMAGSTRVDRRDRDPVQRPAAADTHGDHLDLELEAFLSLCGERKTQERIAFTLKTGKPLRN